MGMRRYRPAGGNRRKSYLQEQLFLHHLLRLADEPLLQGVDFLYKLKGTGVTGLSKKKKKKTADISSVSKY